MFYESSSSCEGAGIFETFGDFLHTSVEFLVIRNKSIHEKSNIHPTLSIEHALSTYKQFQELQDIPFSQIRMNAR